MFMDGDQGVLNYVLLKKLAAGELSIDRTAFMLWGPEETAGIKVAEFGGQSPYRHLIHWAGMKKPRLRNMMRADILLHFEMCYYRRIAFGAARKQVRALEDYAHSLWWRACYRLRRAQSKLRGLYRRESAAT
jgi:hypothetical protein